MLQISKGAVGGLACSMRSPVTGKLGKFWSLSRAIRSFIWFQVSGSGLVDAYSRQPIDLSSCMTRL